MLNKIDELADGIDDKSRSAVLGLIDLKTEDDMEKVMSQIRGMFTEMNTKMDNRFAQMDGKFAQIDGKFAQMDAIIDTKFTHVEASMTTIRWAIGVAGAVITTLLAIIALK